MQRYIEHAMLASAIVFLVILNGEASIKIARNGIDEPPGAPVAWLAAELAELEEPTTLRYEADRSRGLEFWRDLFRARWAMAPHRILNPLRVPDDPGLLVLLEFESEAELRHRVNELGLHLIVQRDGIGLARPADAVAGE